MGLYQQQKRERSQRLCYTVLILCIMAGTAALTVSWLLATGNIDPDRQEQEPQVNNKVPRRLDFFSQGNSYKFSEDKKYPKIVSQKTLDNARSELSSESEDTTEEIPIIIEAILEGSTTNDESLEASEVNVLEFPEERKDISMIEMENFELSDDDVANQNETPDSTDEPIEDSEMTTIQY